MKLFGHPIHPLMIHFPTALLPMDFVLSLLSYFKNDSSFSLAGLYCLAGGVLMGFTVIITGLIDMLQISKTNKPAFALALYHGFVNSFIMLIFVVITYKTWQPNPEIAIPSMIAIVIKGILVLALFAGNYMGGTLIYRHYIGINFNTTEHGNSIS